jgi:hypothetical protein
MPQSSYASAYPSQEHDRSATDRRRVVVLLDCPPPPRPRDVDTTWAQLQPGAGLERVILERDLEPTDRLFMGDRAFQILGRKLLKSW